MKCPVINFLGFCHEYNDPKKFVRVRVRLLSPLRVTLYTRNVIYAARII